jgi:phage regulator Rha-like protein
MADIQVTTVNEILVVDSRLVAEELGIEHRALMQTIKKYIDRLERKEPVTFQMDVVKRPQGGTYEVSYCYLNEWQATLLMTFSRNTEQVLNCKEKLVDAFSEAKKLIKSHQTELTPAEAILQMAQFMVEQERKTKELEAKLALESQRNDQIEELVKQHDAELERIHKPCGDYFTVMGYARLKGINGISLKMANSLGRKASAKCRELGLEIEQVRDPRFGTIGSYPEMVLEELI